jgi:predicted anti-sigma-YlaC factor YlaD
MSEHTHSPTCKHLLGSISGYIDGDLPPEVCALLEEHLKGCRNCRVVVDSLKKTVELYHQTAGPADLPSDVRERLLYRLDLTDSMEKP